MADVATIAGELIRLGRVVADRFVFTPTPHVLSDSIVRVYAACVGDDQIGRVKYFDLDAADPLRVVRESSHVVLDAGRPGTFDDNGVTPLCVVPDGNRLLMYYVGWQLSQQVRYFLFTGLAESTDGGETFQRVQKTPVLERIDDELICRTAAFVMRDDSAYRVWYIGGSETVLVGGKQLPTYSLHYGESPDGVNWGAGREIMAPQRPREFGFGRPWVRRLSSGYEMWYSIRNSDIGYRIAYATSDDGLNWNRRGFFGLDVGERGDWDGEMTAFGAVFDTPAGSFMLYNGNGYGRTGFGLAKVVRTSSPSG